ncbi:MAG TPA: fused MFS/spermidine synthase [Gemmatimonadaceae bacterium]|nr:fused MFS/spermidine synthase [Gemmatimonadaceae bacterium]
MGVASRRWLPVGLFSLAIFLNAGLLFVVQPLFTKMVLPLLGGTPAVWNTCLLFFQAALLGGYLYAHLTSRWLTPMRQGLLHLLLMLVAAILFLPLRVPPSFAEPPGGVSPVPWLLLLLASALGMPFLLLSAGAPMLQRWFAAAGHRYSSNPYFLYAASNLGSFAALLAYPFSIEPTWRLSEQSRLWSWGYLVLAVLLAVCLAYARSVRSRAFPSEREQSGEPELVPNVHWRLRWVLLAFAPSSLLIGVTTYLSTDIAAVPFLWVIPLSLYLLTFVLAFARRPLLPRGAMLALQVPLALVLIVAIAAPPGWSIRWLAVLHLAAFFVTASVCHRALADSRPRVRYLTEFYLWISLGGVLGGVFNVVLAPQLYSSLLEYPFALVIALGLRPAAVAQGRRELLLDLAFPLFLALGIWGVFRLPTPPEEWGSWGTHAVLVLAAMLAAVSWNRPLRLALAAGAIYAAVQLADAASSNVLAQARSFFGIYRVKTVLGYHILQHGTTTHGGQSMDPARRTEPLTYYYREGPLGQIFASIGTERESRRVAVVGLGTGTVACYGKAGERWRFYEIDPLVVRIANDPRLFTYLRDCPPAVDVVLGDARLSLQREPDNEFDLIVLDAFSSDAIPTHLLTREAIEMYMRKLRSGGAVAFHISNRYLDLRPVLIAAANELRLPGVLGEKSIGNDDRVRLYYGSRWIVLAPDFRSLADLVRRDGWEPLASAPAARLWTDDYADVLAALRR